MSQLLRPVDGVDVDAERILAQPIGVGWRLNRDGKDRSPKCGAGERQLALLDPGDAEAVGRSANDAGDVDRDLLLAETGEGSLARA